jgi:hypothetical protein
MGYKLTFCIISLTLCVRWKGQRCGAVAATAQYRLAGAKPFCHSGKARAGRQEMVIK